MIYIPLQISFIYPLDLQGRNAALETDVTFDFQMNPHYTKPPISSSQITFFLTMFVKYPLLN